MTKRWERAVGFFRCTAALCFCVSTACTAPQVPAPDRSLDAYHEAIAQRDADRLWGMLTKEAQSRLTRDDLAEMLDSQHEKLLARSRRLVEEPTTVRQRAELFLADGERVELALEDGEFRVQAGGGLPHNARDPVDAVRELRAAVHARDFRRARAALSQRGQERVDGFFSSLEAALDDAEWGVLEVRGQHAELSLPSGRSVQLRKEEGVWKVEEVK